MPLNEPILEFSLVVERIYIFLLFKLRLCLMCTVFSQDFLYFLPFISFTCFWILDCRLTLLFSLIEVFPLPNTPAVYKDHYYLTPEKLFSPISLHTLHYLGNSYSGNIASSPKMPWFLSSLRIFTYLFIWLKLSSPSFSN